MSYEVERLLTCLNGGISGIPHTYRHVSIVPSVIRTQPGRCKIPPDRWVIDVNAHEQESLVQERTSEVNSVSLFLHTLFSALFCGLKESAYFFVDRVKKFIRCGGSERETARAAEGCIKTGPLCELIRAEVFSFNFFVTYIRKC